MKKKYNTLKFIVVVCSIVVLALLCVRVGTIQVSVKELIDGLITGNNPQVEIIKMVRLPRIFVSLLSGATLAVSGVLLQAVMRNPLADPGIVGISAGASFMTSLVVAFVPNLFYMAPVFGLLGGLMACGLVYSFAWKKGLNPGRIILAGIAINALFNSGAEVITYMTSTGISPTIAGASVSTGKTWDVVRLMVFYGIIGLTLAVIVAKKCNLLALGEKNARSLGLNVNRERIVISVVAVFLAIIPTTQVGVISFVGLIVPHLGRLLIGTDHYRLIPFTALLGGAMMLFADLLSRVMAYPVEIPIGIVMSIIGAPFFLYMLRKKDNTYAS